MGLFNFKSKSRDLTLTEAKELLQSQISNGAICPCCGRYTKIYRRKINAGMAKFLKALYVLNEAQKSSYSANDVLKSIASPARSLDYGVLVHFGLIKKVSGDRYEITELGKEFVEGKSSAPKYVYVQNNVLVDKTGKCYFKDAQKEKFSKDNI
jgi:hypothetical protein